MSNDKYLTYRGTIKDIIGIGSSLVFVTIHPERQPTAIYRLNAEKVELAEDALAGGATALIHDGEQIWFTATDSHLYTYKSSGGAPKKLGKAFDAIPSDLFLLSNDRLALLVKKEIVIVQRKDGKVLQTLELEESGSAIASDPTGNWLTVGSNKGTVSVYESESQSDLQFSASAKLHEGAVTALLFEREELRFFSAGDDHKLLSTHARGNLEPEDRGRGANHTDRITDMIWGSDNRFFTGSRDKTVKGWPWPGNMKPATLKDGIIRVTALTMVEIHRKPHLAIVCDDNSIRIFNLDSEGRAGELVTRYRDAIANMKHELEQQEPARREAALKTLAKYNDNRSLELLSKRIGDDQDHTLRLSAIKLLAKSDHSRAGKLLENWLNHTDEKVRIQAFEGLRKHAGESALEPMDLALETGKPDIGKLAIEALQPLALKDDRALTKLIDILDHTNQEVRLATIPALEKVYPKDSPEANLIALQSDHGEVRRQALIRLYQRKLLNHPQVVPILRWRLEDSDAEVRRAAFLLMLHTREKLVSRLRQLDPELDRQISELESAKSKDKATAEASVEKQMEAVAEQAKKAEKYRKELTESDYEPLLQSTASRSLDTCLRGARGLALFGLPRSLGLLLQLSREEDPQARVDVCKALAALDDPRSVKRLRSLLYDNEAAVRDAAFTALQMIYADTPIQSAEAGLQASFEDVRRRGLQVLTTLVRKNPPKSPDDPLWGLLIRALNDNFQTVRSETFKAALNLKIGGGGAETLRFALQSIQPDIRLEVLTEIIAQIKQPWAWQLLLSFYNDPDETLRGEAFDFAKKQGKEKELEALEAALCSRFIDLRQLAVEELIKLRTPQAQSLLVNAMTDDEEIVRQRALNALILDDARPALLEALKSEHTDIRSGAGVALARQGEPAAFDALVELASTPEPKEEERVADWVKIVRTALDGLAALGDVRAHAHGLKFIESKHAPLRKSAAIVLQWCSRKETISDLQSLLQHSDDKVKMRAAFGLAILGDPLVASIVMTEEFRGVLGATGALIATLCLGEIAEDQLYVFLDDQSEQVRMQALFLILMLEMLDPQPTPSRCLAALSSLMPRVRLKAAQALENYADREKFRQFVLDTLNNREDEKSWNITQKTLDSFAALIVEGDPHLRARTGLRLSSLTDQNVKTWTQAWSAHRRRYAEDIKEVLEKSQNRKVPKLEQSEDELHQLAFGAYVGLVREQGGTRGQGQHNVPWPQVIRVRQTALKRIEALAANEEFTTAAKSVFIQALGDPNSAVRLQAFEQLQSLGMDTIQLGSEALEAGHLDLGIKGLELLTDGTNAKEGRKVLEQVMMTRKDNLSVEAARIVGKEQGMVQTATSCLEAAFPTLRIRGVTWLAAEYDQSSEAQQALREAVKSRYRHVREKAVFELATKKDSQAFDSLSTLLTDTDEEQLQLRIAKALVQLEDARGPDAILDRIDNDPRGTANAEPLFRFAGRFRQPKNADRIFEMIQQNKKWRAGAYETLLVISGYDQHIEEDDEDNLERKWLEKQYPRHDDLLARLMQWCLEQGVNDRLRQLIPHARWSLTNEVEPVLTILANHSDEQIRNDAVEALGWRAWKRNGSLDAVEKALNHKDPQTQFIAAEGLARSGKADGMNVLMSSIEYMSDIALTHRAVEALGVLADERALDVLLKLADHPEHPSQSAAAEAIGHMRNSERKEDVFKLLTKLAQDDGQLGMLALKGFRWFDTPEGWKIIRQRLQSDDFWWGDEAIPLLAHNDDPATRDLLLKLIREQSAYEAVMTARKLFGPDSLEPDYAILLNEFPEEFDELYDEAIKRIQENGDPARLFEVLGKTTDEHSQAILINALLTLDKTPVKEASEALDSHQSQVVQVASQVLGRAEKQDAKAAKRLESTLEHWLKKWEGHQITVMREGEPNEEREGELLKCLNSLVWALGKCGQSQKVLLDLLTSFPEDTAFRSVRFEAMTALSFQELPKGADEPLQKLAISGDPEIRVLAADLLGKYREKLAVKLADEMLSDRVSFNRMLSNEGVQATATLRTASEKVHYQGVSLPHLIEQRDIDGLVSVMNNGELSESTRLGAIEALGRMAHEDAEAKLVEMGKDESQVEAIRKQAWRSLRRSKRLRVKESTT